ncbi:uncharacterized protein TNCV_3800151 [Trichonephila clavipes]|nr:uncharacterized protein TNCV_3800151 [Trichonephila clavipes]
MKKAFLTLKCYTISNCLCTSNTPAGKNRLRIFTLRLTGGAHRYHCSRRKQKPTSDVNKTLTGGAQRTSLNQSPGDQSHGFSTADSLWLGTRACAVLAISLHCQSMFRYFTARLEILTLKLGEWGATSVVLLVTQLKFQITVFERRVHYKPLLPPDFAFSGYERNKSSLSSSVDLSSP